MTSAREINKKLDEIIEVQNQINELQNDLPDNATLNSLEGGETVTKEFVINKGQEQLLEIENDLNQITDNGRRCPRFPFNDVAQDKIITNEIKANKQKEELEKQKAGNN